jgi:hypothetical protein
MNDDLKANKQAYIDFIIECFGKGFVERGEVMAMFGKKWQTPPRTFDRYFKQAKEQYTKHRELINKEKLNTTIEEEVKALQSGLKSKIERVLELQKQYDEIDLILQNGVTDTHAFSQGALITGIRPLNALEISKLHLTIKDIRAEISKIEGDYAPNKLDISTENPIPIFNQNPLNE